MQYWPWWLSGIALSGVMVFHWFALHRMMAVSGRVTALIDRLRHGAPEPVQAMSAEELLAAIQAATTEEFGADASGSDPPPTHASDGKIEMPVVQAPRTSSEHFLFLGGLVCGGVLATALGAGFSPTSFLAGTGFATLTDGSPLTASLFLAFGGVLVGFGTRMSGGCTSGHGLCGSSRLQPGSLLATLSFFGVGILVSFGLRALL